MRSVGEIILKSEVQNRPTEDDGSMALLLVTEQIASFAERLSGDFKEQNGEIALLTFARTLRAVSHKTWAK